MKRLKKDIQLSKDLLSGLSAAKVGEPHGLTVGSVRQSFLRVARAISDQKLNKGKGIFKTDSFAEARSKKDVWLECIALLEQSDLAAAAKRLRQVSRPEWSDSTKL